MTNPKDLRPAPAESELNERTLIERCQRGDKSAFDQLVARHEYRIFRLIRRHFPNPEDARDITQDVFLKAYQGLSNFRKGSSFYTWLYRIAQNRCIDLRRQNAPREMMTYQLVSDDLAMLEIGDPRSAPPSKALESAELLQHIHQAVELLSPKQREIFELRFWDGLALKDIAETVGRSTGTVKAHLFHAVRNVRKLLLPYLQFES